MTSTLSMPNGESAAWIGVASVVETGLAPTLVALDGALVPRVGSGEVAGRVATWRSLQPAMAKNTHKLNTRMMQLLSRNGRAAHEL
jgi:hypothetical protein